MRTRARTTVATVVASAMVLLVLAAVHAPPAHAAPPRRVSITDATVVEGDSGSQGLSFTISYTGKNGSNISVQYATADDTATAGSDYTGTSGTASLPNGGCKCATVTVDVLGDLTQETAESFSVNLSNPTGGASIRDGVGVGTIYDNDGPPEILALAESVNEGAGTATFSAMLTSSDLAPVSVSFATADGTAVAPNDYTATSGTVLFVPGDTAEPITVPIVDDAVAEDDETFTIQLSNPVGATIAGPQVVGTIVSDDADPTISVADVAVAEGNAGSAMGSITLTLSEVSEKAIGIGYSTTSAGATAGVDYISTSGTASFGAGDLVETVQIPVLGDDVDEPDEGVTLTLTDEDNLTIADGQGLLTITDDDAAAVLSIDDVSVVEADGGTTTTTFTITKAGSTAFTVTADWTTADGTASAGSDYTAASGSVSFGPAAVTRTVQVSVAGDTIDEPDETLEVWLAGPANATLGDDLGVGTILDDDGAVTALTLSVTRTARRVTARGVLEIAAADSQVKVTLLKKRDGRYRKVSARTVTVNGLGDRDIDALADAAYKAGFKRPAGHGRYMIKVTFAGTLDLEPSTASRRFRL